MEAQGDLLADYFAIKFLGLPEIIRMKQYKASLWLYEDVLSEFINYPGSATNLP